VAAQPSVLHLSPDDDLVLALKRAARDHQLVLVNTGDEVIEISAVSTRPAEDDVDHCEAEEPDAILELIGILESSEPSNIAEFKDQYIADAIDPRPR
jgi:hypothetical protein